MLNNVQNDAVSDTTDGDSNSEAGNQSSEAATKATPQVQEEVKAIEFAEWVSNNQFTCYNSYWVSTKIHYSPNEYTTKELYQLFQSRKKL